MRGSSIEFFADKQDLVSLFQIFDEQFDVTYTQCMSYINQACRQYSSAVSLLDFLVSFEKPVQSNLFLITPPSNAIRKRVISMKDGSGTKEIIDQNLNPDSIEILLGGQADQTTLVTTTIKTLGETVIAKDLFKRFKKIVTSNSTKVGENYYVFPNALVRLRDGWRLTAGIEYSPALDLKMPSGQH